MFLEETSHLLRFGVVTVPPASSTKIIPEAISQILRLLPQKASSLPEATKARSKAADPNALKLVE